MSGKDPKFYACDKCHVIVEEVCGDKSTFTCDGVELQPMIPNTSEGAREKHLPVTEQAGGQITVKVGSVFHPMSAEHSIEWVYLQTEKGCQRVCLRPDEEPVAVFALAPGDRPIAAYAYCNLHGFWKTEL